MTFGLFTINLFPPCRGSCLRKRGDWIADFGSSMAGLLPLLKHDALTLVCCPNIGIRIGLHRLGPAAVRSHAGWSPSLGPARGWTIFGFLPPDRLIQGQLMRSRHSACRGLPFAQTLGTRHGRARRSACCRQVPVAHAHLVSVKSHLISESF